MARKALIIPPGAGRVYPAGRMQAIFKADMDETNSKYSVSEWWLDPGARLPNQHLHEEDHIGGTSRFVTRKALSGHIGNGQAARKPGLRGRVSAR